MADPLDDVLGGTNGHRPVSLTAPTFERHGDDFTFMWRDHDVTIGVDRIREHSEGTHAEITVTVPGAEPQWGRFNLASSTTRTHFAKTLDASAPGIPWRLILERVCRDTVRAVRVGAPTVLLRPRQTTEPAFLVDPILPLDDSAVIFADGGSGKGFFVIALALAAMNGLTLPGGISFATSRPTGVLYLDWESTQADLEDRVYRLAHGLGCSADRLHYRRMERPLTDDAGALRADASRLGVGLVIVDSLAPACGPEPEGSDAVTRTMNALRAFGPTVTRAVVAHVSKAAAEQRGTSAKPFGSVFVWNLARSVWELRRSEDETNDLVVGLYHRKANGGRLHPPIGLRLAFAPDAIALEAANLSESSDLLARASLRIRAVLSPGALTTAEVADALGVSEDTAGRTLRRMSGKGVVRLPNDEGGRVRWGLLA